MNKIRRIATFAVAVFFVSFLVKAGFNAFHIHQNAVLEAQVPPIPQAVPVLGALDVQSAGSSTIIAAPGSTLRTYLYSASCVNMVNSATAVILSTSNGTAASIIYTMPCAASALAQNPPVYFNPPIRMSLNGVLVATIITTAGTSPRAFINASGFTAR